MSAITFQPDLNPADVVDSVFEPLGWHQNDIRLVELHPAECEYSLIICTLHCVNLDNNPSYEALSWAWGDASQAETILLQGELWQAPHNLVAALRSLRHPQHSRTLWVDALCINQSQANSVLHERGHQVSLMKRVYATAERVIIWLGVSVQWTCHFFADLRTLATPELSIDHGCDLISSRGKELRTQNWIFVKWLWEFISRPWWRRLWVLQEVALAHRAVVACDMHLVSFEEVLRAFRIIRLASKKLDSSKADSQRFTSWAGYITMIEDLRRFAICRLSYKDTIADDEEGYSQLSEEESFLRYAKLLAGCRFQLSTDPRDMIYGILGLSADTVNQQIYVRYDMSVRDVYMQITLKLLHKTKSLFVLGQAQIAMWKSANSATNHKNESGYFLPSWTPDWSLKRREFGYSSEARCRSRVGREDLFNAARGTKAKFNLLNEHVLRLRGIRVDRVKSLHKIWLPAGTSFIPNIGFLREWTDISLEGFAATRTDKAHSQAEENDIAYIGGGDRITAFWKTWAHDMHPTDEFEQIRRCDKSFIEVCEHWRISNVEKPSDKSSTYTPFPFPDLVSSTTFINMRLVLTEAGFVGLGNAMIEIGDNLFVLAGGTHPFVLRDCPSEKNRYRVVGEVYIHGVMDGESLTEPCGSAKRRTRVSDANGGKRPSDPADPADPYGIWEDVFLE